MGKIDRAALRQRIQTLEGLSDDERAALLQLAAEGRSYGLVWEEREEAVEERLREELPVLVEDKELALTNGCKDAPNHILIEGDNLEALTTLSYTHEGKVDVIYIDPPYNTGNKDFVYNDSFVDSEDSYRHSKWLSFMSKRLRIAKRLLSDRGVIFIPIDDNEQANLKLLCDEVFGERNFVTNFVWQSTAGSNTGTDIITVTEYVMLYCKNRDNVVFDGQETQEETFPYSDEFEEIRGKYALDKLDRRRVGGHYSEALNFPVECPDGTLRWPGGGMERSTEGWNYLWSNTKINWGKENGFIVFKKGKDGWNIYNKRYSKIDNTGKRIERTTPFRNLITSDLFNTAQGTAEITSIFGVRTFDFPKPSNLIKYLLTTIVRTHKSSTVLDFFAGSGTTLHAVMQLNKEDGGRRQCILVTNNENNICREVTYERNRRVIEGYTTPKGAQVEGLRDNNLRYYRTRLLPRERTGRNMRMLVAAATDLLCIKEGIFGEIGFSDFRKQDARLFADGEKRMLVIYNEEVIPEIVEWIKTASATNAITQSGNHVIKVYVFSPGAYAWDDDFAEVIDRVELCALPEAIYQAYKNVLPKKKADVIGNMEGGEK